MAFYPVSRKIVTHYFARNDIFSIFAAEIILFSCKIWFHYYNAPSYHYG